MEAAISSSLKHDNIVRTHTYSLAPIREGGGGSAPGSGANLRGTGTPSVSSSLLLAAASTPTTAFEVKIVLERCDLGTLRSALSR